MTWGSAIAEAQRKVKEQVVIPAGYTLKWTGDFENQQRASKRLGQVVPVSIAIIFIILFMLFGNARDAGLVLFNVPFAAVGGIAALLMTGSISRFRRVSASLRCSESVSKTV